MHVAVSKMFDASKADTITISLSVLAAIAVILRCISRFAILKRPSIDDYLAILAVALSATLTALIAMRKFRCRLVDCVYADYYRATIWFRPAFFNCNEERVRADAQGTYVDAVAHAH